MANVTIADLTAVTSVGAADIFETEQSGASRKTTALLIRRYTLGNDFVQFTGPATAAKTFTLPDANATILTTNAAVTVPQGGTGVATLTGIVKGNGAAAMSAASPGVDYGFPGIPVNSKSADYTFVLGDANQGFLHPSADTNARTFTIPANASVAFPVNTCLTFINQNAAGVLTIAITSDTMRLAGAGTTGSRTLAANGVATAWKISATEWIINGVGLS